jgi:hypothetical protein
MSKTKILENIKKSQKEWADAKNVPTERNGKGKYNFYTKSIRANFFMNLSENSFEKIKDGDGGEISLNSLSELNSGVSNENKKFDRIQALYSSTALVVNIFEY